MKEHKLIAQVEESEHRKIVKEEVFQFVDPDAEAPKNIKPVALKLMSIHSVDPKDHEDKNTVTLEWKESAVPIFQANYKELVEAQESYHNIYTTLERTQTRLQNGDNETAKAEAISLIQDLAAKTQPLISEPQSIQLAQASIKHAHENMSMPVRYKHPDYVEDTSEQEEARYQAGYIEKEEMSAIPEDKEILRCAACEYFIWEPKGDKPKNWCTHKQNQFQCNSLIGCCNRYEDKTSQIWHEQPIEVRIKQQAGFLTYDECKRMGQEFLAAHPEVQKRLDAGEPIDQVLNSIDTRPVDPDSANGDFATTASLQVIMVDSAFSIAYEILKYQKGTVDDVYAALENAFSVEEIERAIESVDAAMEDDATESLIEQELERGRGA